MSLSPLVKTVCGSSRDTQAACTSAPGMPGAPVRLDESAGLAGGSNQRNSPVAAAAPSSCAMTNAVTSSGRIPAKVLLAARAMVTAGLGDGGGGVKQNAGGKKAPPADGET